MMLNDPAGVLHCNGRHWVGSTKAPTHPADVACWGGPLVEGPLTAQCCGGRMLVGYGTDGETFHLLEGKALVAGHTTWNEKAHGRN